MRRYFSIRRSNLNSGPKTFMIPQPWPCVSLIGMPGAGKTTLGKLVAEKLGWAFIDTDHLIEAFYGARLQDITDALGKENFLDMEADMICALRVSRCVIATGGSVVYRPRAVKHLKSLGSVARLDLSLETVVARIALKPDRGIAIAPGQTLEDLFNERQKLYTEAAGIVCDVESRSPDECAEWLVANLPGAH